MANLDGTDAIKPVAFDAHEQATRGVHVATAVDSPDKDPATVAEFPKAVDHVDHPYQDGLKEAVVVKSAEEEKAYLDAQAEAKADLPQPAQ